MQTFAHTTIQHIARLAGVAPSTVSRALSGKPGVSEQRRAFIAEVARAAGYEPDPFARSLRTGRGVGLTLITPIELSEIARIRDLRLLSLAKAVYGQTRLHVHNPGDNFDELIRRCIAEKPLAIALSGIRTDCSEQTRELLRARNIALVAIDSDCRGCDSVQIDRGAGTYQAARMLLLTGCRFPVFFTFAGSDAPDARMKGVLAAFESLGRTANEDCFIYGRAAGHAQGLELAREALRTRPVDGLFCYNDNMAIGALRALYKEHIDVPEQVRVIGFDNLPVSANLPVSLTTVAQPVDEAAQAALAFIQSRLEHPDLPPRGARFSTHLIIRESAPLVEHGLRERVFEKIDSTQ